MKKGFRYALLATAILLLASCSATKYVPEGSYLLDEVRIQTDNKEIKPSSLSMYVRQNPNAKWFSLIKTQLYVYNWSGRDSTRWINRTLRRMGDAPVIYKAEETERSGEEMTKAIQNMGYMSATVEPVTHVKKKKLKLTYKVSSGKPYKIRSLKYDIKDEKIKEYTTVWMDTLRGGKSQLVNTNKLVRHYSGATGLKTGTTAKAGHCLSATAEKNGMGLCAVILGCATTDERFGGARKMLDYGFANYENVTPQMPFDAPEAISVSHGTADKVELIYSTPTRFLMPKNAAEPLTSTIELPQKLAAPVAQGTHLGTVQLSNGGEVLASFPISAAQGVDALSFRYCFGRLVDSLLLYQGDFVQNK